MYREFAFFYPILFCSHFRSHEYESLSNFSFTIDWETFLLIFFVITYLVSGIQMLSIVSVCGPDTYSKSNRRKELVPLGASLVKFFSRSTDYSSGSASMSVAPLALPRSAG